MNSHYHFHKQLANEQVQARLQEAENHRMGRHGNSRSSLYLLVKLTFPLLVGLAVVILLLSSCTPGDVLSEKSDSHAVAAPAMTMAERIHFQDSRETKFEVNQENSSVEEMTLADRIFFQDKRDEYLFGELVGRQSSDWTMAERIQFHDRIWRQ